VAIYLGNGDGTFQAPVTYSLPFGGAQALVIGDFTGDGIPDIVARDTGSIRPPHPPGFDLLVGNGDGTFQDAVRTDDQAGSRFDSLIAADLNNDGTADLVYTDTTKVVVRLNHGDGTIEAPGSYDVGHLIRSDDAMDVNGDGFPDLLIPSPFDNGIKVLLNNGDGPFEFGPVRLVGSDFSGPVVFADFNGDGYLDLATALEVNHGIGVRLGRPDGTFQMTPTYATGQNPWDVAVGDFTGDGLPDLAVTNAIGNGTVSILAGNGDGTFQSPRSFTTGPDPTAIVAGDFTGAHHLDLVVTSDLGVQLFLGNGNGTFRDPVLLSSLPSGLAAGDFNGDGKLDLVLSNDAGAQLLLGNGDGTFQAPVVVFNTSTDLAVGDFNGDHKLDLAVLDDRGSLNVLLGNGDGTFQPARNYTVGSNPQSIAAADLRGDGRDDLVIATAPDDYSQPGAVKVFLSNADASFQPAVSYQIGPNPGQVVVGDFTGHHRQDIAILEGSSALGAAAVRLLVGNGDGTFQVNPFTYSLSSGLGNHLAAGDFNRDGALDLVATNTLDNNVSVLLNTGSGGSPGGSHGSMPAPVPGVADGLSDRLLSVKSGPDSPVADARPDPLQSLVAATLEGRPHQSARTPTSIGWLAEVGRLETSALDEVFTTLVEE
jgi:hypothetical protein